MRMEPISTKSPEDDRVINLHKQSSPPCHTSCLCERHGWKKESRLVSTACLLKPRDQHLLLRERLMLCFTCLKMRLHGTVCFLLVILVVNTCGHPTKAARFLPSPSQGSPISLQIDGFDHDRDSQRIQVLKKTSMPVMPPNILRVRSTNTEVSVPRTIDLSCFCRCRGRFRL